MDIKHLEYFLAIVENDFNLSKASKVLYISQPALSKFIKDFESKEQVELFVRYKGRLINLTPAGKEFLDHAQLVIKDYNILMESLRNKITKPKGKIIIGIPPVILTVLFSKVIPKFIQANPEIELKIIEAGAYELQKMLLLQEIDIAFLISPIVTPNISHTPILKNNVSVIFGKKHKFNCKLKNVVSFKDLESESLAILNSEFMIYHQIINRFNLENITPNIIFTSSSWDLLISMCEQTNTVSILPTPIVNYYNNRNKICTKLINPNFSWIVEICKLTNVSHNQLIAYTEKFFLTELETK